jgi:hypothetical protein
MDEYILDEQRNLPTPPSEEEIVVSDDSNGVSEIEVIKSVTENESDTFENESIKSSSVTVDSTNEDDDNIPSASEIIKKARSKSLLADNATIIKALAGM